MTMNITRLFKHTNVVNLRVYIVQFNLLKPSLLPSASQVGYSWQHCTRAPGSEHGSWLVRPCCGPSASVPSPAAGTSCRAPCWPPALGGGVSAGCSWQRGPQHRAQHPRSALLAGSPPPPRWVWPGGRTCTPPPSCGGGPPSIAAQSRPGEIESGCCGRKQH